MPRAGHNVLRKETQERGLGGGGGGGAWGALGCARHHWASHAPVALWLPGSSFLCARFSPSDLGARRCGCCVGGVRSGRRRANPPLCRTRDQKSSLKASLQGCRLLHGNRPPLSLEADHTYSKRSKGRLGRPYTCPRTEPTTRRLAPTTGASIPFVQEKQHPTQTRSTSTDTSSPLAPAAPLFPGPRPSFFALEEHLQGE